MCNVIFYQTLSSNSHTKTYTAPTTVSKSKNEVWTGSSDHMDNDISRIVTSDNTWVWIYSGPDCRENDENLVIGPNTDIKLSLAGMDDTIESFAVYDHNPVNVVPNTQYKPTYVQFWQGSKYNGRTQVFEGEKNYHDTSLLSWMGDSNDNMGGDIQCLQTGPQGWVRISTSKNYGGNSILIGPNQKLQLKAVVINGATMDKAIHSFQLYPNNPNVDIDAVIENFIALYPGSQRKKVDGFNVSEFYAQNSLYRVFDPFIEATKSVNNQINVLKFTIKVEHEQGLGSTDKATITFSMDYEGHFVDTISISYDMGSALQIPDWAITLMDSAADFAISKADKGAKLIADAAVELFTDGTGTEELPEINQGIDKAGDIVSKGLAFCIDHINSVLKVLYEMQDNGGKMYFYSIAGHCIPRMADAYYQTIFNSTNEIPMVVKDPLSFNVGAFLTNLTGTNSWDTNEERHNPFVEFNAYTYPYRCYYPDNTIIYGNYGAVSSAKITAITKNGQDDYLDLQAAFDNAGTLLLVQGTADLFGNKDEDAPTTGVLVIKGGIVWQCKEGLEPEETVYLDLYTALSSEMANALADSSETKTGQRDGLVDAASAVLTAMQAAFS